MTGRARSIGHWLRECARASRLVRSDMRGFGMSEWDAAGVQLRSAGRRPRRGDRRGRGRAMRPARHVARRARSRSLMRRAIPERVRKLVLVNSFAAGWRVRADPEEIAWRESLLEMNRRQPSFRRSLLGEMFITLYFPSARPGTDRLAQ